MLIPDLIIQLITVVIGVVLYTAILRPFQVLCKLKKLT